MSSVWDLLQGLFLQRHKNRMGIKNGKPKTEKKKLMMKYFLPSRLIKEDNAMALTAREQIRSFLFVEINMAALQIEC